MDLKEIRKEIDTVDDELIKLFKKRMELSAQVAEYKIKNHLPVYVPSREQEILLDVANKVGPELSEYASKLYTVIFELSRNYQIMKIAAKSNTEEMI